MECRPRARRCLGTALRSSRRPAATGAGAAGVAVAELEGRTIGCRAGLLRGRAAAPVAGLRGGALAWGGT